MRKLLGGHFSSPQRGCGTSSPTPAVHWPVLLKTTPRTSKYEGGMQQSYPTSFTGRTSRLNFHSYPPIIVWSLEPPAVRRGTDLLRRRRRSHRKNHLAHFRGSSLLRTHRCCRLSIYPLESEGPMPFKIDRRNRIWGEGLFSHRLAFATATKYI